MPVTDVLSWLIAQNVIATAGTEAAFLEESVDDIGTIKELSDGELKELGFKLGDRAKIRKAEREMEEVEAPAVVKARPPVRTPPAPTVTK
jgi:hypothetical protein